MAATKRFGRRLGTWWEPDLISGAGRARPEWDVTQAVGRVQALGFSNIQISRRNAHPAQPVLCASNKKCHFQ